MLAQHPAETGGVAAAVALLIGHWLGLTDPTTVASLAIVIGFIPALITWLVVSIETRNKTAASNGTSTSPKPPVVSIETRNKTAASNGTSTSPKPPV